jgi:hypothetical protein
LAKSDEGEERCRILDSDNFSSCSIVHFFDTDRHRKLPYSDLRAIPSESDKKYPKDFREIYSRRVGAHARRSRKIQAVPRPDNQQERNNCHSESGNMRLIFISSK